MEVDRHKLWRIVGNNYRSLEQVAPEGYQPVIEVYLAGREAPFRIDQVQTDRRFDWIFLSSETDDHTEDTASPNERVILAPEQCIMRVEVFLEPSEKRAVGFSHRPLEDDEPNKAD